MPYKSEAQRKFMHARKPKIAAKWDAEEKGQIKKLATISKSKRELAAGLGVAAVGGAVANQIPPVQQVVSNRKRKRSSSKKELRKNLEPVWVVKNYDPDFNTEVAKKVFDLVSKMDDDTAEMFTYFTACEMLDEDIQKNQRVLARHANDVVAKRLESVKKAVVSIAKRDGLSEEALAYTEAISKLEEISKLTPYDYGFRFQESGVRRNERGQFATEVKVNENAKPFTDSQMKAMGHAKAVKRIDDLKNEKTGGKMGAKARAQFQQEYLQVADFLNTFKQSGGDSVDDKVLVHIEDKKSGQRYSVPASATGRVPTAWDPRTERVVALEARPVRANMAGASYNLGQALGASAATSRGMAFTGERLDQNLKPFEANWNTAERHDNLNTNARTYRRVQSGSQLVGATTPPGSAIHNAARLAEFAGQHGPEAEKVFGPAARKTAYRYRGTEKTPDAHIVTLYNRAVQDAKRAAPGDQGEGPEHLGRRMRGTPEPGVAPAVGQMATAGAVAAQRKPTWDEREAGRREIQRQLFNNERFPRKQLYGLQLAAGNTPPSEGILLNRDGQIVTQAVGYGDDHYLPFNLKNLKALKGGEYIRTRSVGGPTSEDIYTGLLTGARQVTVISRSGTFIVTFDETLRGGRRYNDKAMRMTDRYEHLLDALESEQVDAKPIPNEIRDRIQSDIEREYGDWSPAEQRRMFKQKEEEYKSAGTALTREDKQYIQARVQLEMDRDPTGNYREIERMLVADRMADKEFKYKLNGAGYGAALDALQEQFPYYIKTRYVPRRDEELAEPERDKGYVMPRHNRPVGALHGYFNPRIEGVGEHKYQAGEMAGQKSGKIAASEANYQNLPYSTIRNPAKAEEATSSYGAGGDIGTGGGEGGAPSAMGGSPEQRKVREVKENIREGVDEDDYVNKAWALVKGTSLAPQFVRNNPLAAMAAAGQEQEFKARVKTAAGRAEVHQMVQAPGFAKGTLWTDYRHAYSAVDRKNYSDTVAFTWEDKPYKFPEEVYRKTADATLVENKLVDLNSHALPVSSLKSYREMSDDEKAIELKTLTTLATRRDQLKGPAQRDLLAEAEVHNLANASKLLEKPEKAILKQAKSLHQIRTLQHNQTRQAAKQAAKQGPGQGPGQSPEASGPAAGGSPTPPPKDYDPTQVSGQARERSEREAGGPVIHTGTPPQTRADKIEKLKGAAAILDKERENWASHERANAAMNRQVGVIEFYARLLENDPNATVLDEHIDALVAGADAMIAADDAEEIPGMAYDPRTMKKV